MAERPCGCAVPTPKKFIVELSAVVICQASPAENMTCLRCEVGRFTKEVGHFRPIFDREGGVTHQPMLVSEN